MLVAFAPPPPAVAKPAEEPVKAKAPIKNLPTFKPRWWYDPHRLDARPVVWSLENHPEEWEAVTRSILCHKPSRHRFFISDTVCRLEGSYCDCQDRSNGEFQLWQNHKLRAAKRIWELEHYGVNHTQFAGHFVHA